MFAETHEYPDTIQLTESQVYEGKGPKLLKDFSESLNCVDDAKGGTYSIKIYFNKEGQISDIHIHSHCKEFDSPIVKDCISETLRNLPGWKVGPSPVLTRVFFWKIFL